MIRSAIAKWLHARRAIALAAIALLTFIGLTAAQLARFWVGTENALKTGEVAPRDIRAPFKITYVSDLDTNRQRDLAVAAISAVYSPPDAQIARRQIQLAREVLDKIALARAGQPIAPITPSPDSPAPTQVPVADRPKLLAAIQNVKLDDTEIQLILKSSDTRWALIDSQIITLLDEALRNPIRTDNLDTIKARLPGLVSFIYTPDEASLISEFVADLTVPNTTVDANATTQARTRARNSISPVERTYEANQIIVRAGEIVSATDLEALEKFNLRRADLTLLDVLGALVMSMLVVMMLALAVSRYHVMMSGRLDIERVPLRRTFLSVFFLVMALYFARWQLPGRPLFAYIVPISAIGMAVTSWSRGLTGIVTSLTLASLGTVGSDNSLELTAFYAIGGVVACLSVGRAERISDFVWSGTMALLAQLIILAVFEVPAWQVSNDTSTLITRFVFAIIGGVLSMALAPAFLYIAGLPMRIITPLQLLDLSRPSHPLIQQLLTTAPGTYHHSLMVANLAEQAAERIGADALLTRVGAYYHDIGKTVHPYFFIENQLDGSNNPHDQLDPLSSSKVLHDHVLDGLKMAHKHRLPIEIQAFIAEHHGTTRAGAGYYRASKDNPTLDDKPYRYPGPRPRSRETAILMLADGCEAIVRAKRPSQADETIKLINKIVSERLNDHQLDDSDLTLHEIDMVRQSFAETLRGIYHPRIDYPDIMAPSQNK
ncbi:MAG: HDIG domain-containing protein [Anaerolineae bacterium]|nr:HDIG domain-containing protein [Anaerolineae bacterium]